MESGLSSKVQSAFYFQQTSQVRPPRLTRSLLQILRKGRVPLREMEPVEDFLFKGGRFLAVRTPKGAVAADGVVIAAGAWCGSLYEKLNISPVVKPYRGQVVLYRTPPGSLSHILFQTTS